MLNQYATLLFRVNVCNPFSDPNKRTAKVHAERPVRARVIPTTPHRDAWLDEGLVCVRPGYGALTD
jgi:hypothetical protein